jgi:hypothetical protein
MEISKYEHNNLDEAREVTEQKCKTSNKNLTEILFCERINYV